MNWFPERPGWLTDWMESRKVRCPPPKPTPIVDDFEAINQRVREIAKDAIAHGSPDYPLRKKA